VIEEPELIEELGALDAAINPEGEADDDDGGDRGAEVAREQEEQMTLVDEVVENDLSEPPVRDQGASPVLRLIEQTRAEREARHDRVADLFPRPETTEWSVREIAYDRKRRAQIREVETQAS
jgi:hypothetical protein